jgi:Na+:H+ antiporter, NhaA family
LEVKREMTVGHLASRRSGALPIAAALGGMVVPALLYALVIPAGDVVARVGRPDGDGHRVHDCPDRRDGRACPGRVTHLPHRGGHLDDIGAIVVVAAFYCGDIHPGYLGVAAAVVVALALLSRSRIHLLSPYILLGIALWAFVYAGGLHATLAGVVLALFIPTRPPADLAALMTQASTIIASEARHEGEVLRHGPSTPALHALDAIYDRIESPTDWLLRQGRGRATPFFRSSRWLMQA